jgi:hypothetical protein
LAPQRDILRDPYVLDCAALSYRHPCGYRDRTGHCGSCFWYHQRSQVIRPLATILSLPFIILTLGLFLFVLNALLLWLVGGVVPGFHVYGFWAAFWGAIWLGIISWVINAIGLRTGLEKAA